MYRYVVVGAGSAGCTLANRLSQDPSCRVLLIEAGGSDRKLNIRLPVTLAKPVGHVRQAVPYRPRLGLYVRAGAGADRALDLPPARPLAGRVELDERDDLHARPPLDLRRLGG